MKVVLVDDEQITNFITRRLLKQIDAEMDIVDYTDPFNAIKEIPGQAPEYIFLDLNMPDMNGWQFLDKMAEQGIPNKVIILSSSVSAIDEARAKQYKNVVAFIQKPTRKESLIPHLK
jgi:CheY-like chemotaxis protein